MSFIPDLPVILQFAIATFIITITPGPDMTLFIGRALSEGRGAGLACLSGALTGIVIHTGLVALGLSALITASPQAFLALKIAGGAYLLWLAYQAIRHGSTFSPQVGPGARHSLFQNWLMGLAINLLNPKIIIFFMTFLPQFVIASDPNASGKLFFLGLLFIPLALPITVALVLAADRLAGLLRRNPRAIRVVEYLFAGVFSVFALRILAAQSR